MEDDKFKEFGESEKGNFKAVDTIGHPHPYCITPKHLELNEGMYLDIEATEEKGAVCDICREVHNKDKSKPILKYSEHKQILLIGCNPKEELQGNKELKQYLLKIKDLTEKKGYIGFAFLKGFKHD